MASFNRVIIAGNLTRDPDYKQLSSGQAVCTLGIASNRQFKNKQSGSMVQEVCFVDVEVWGPQAESCRQYLQKGRPVLIEGRLKFNSWEDAGQKRSKHTIVADRVVFLSSGQTADMNAEMDAGMEAAPQSEMEKDLLSQIQTIKNKKTASFATKSEFDEAKPARRKKESSDMGAEVEFKDQPPFQDDLPF